MEFYWFYIFVLIIGLAIGSFLNVLIYRIPRNLKFATGRSFCPKCKAPIKFYDNIPLISYIILGGKCRACKIRIPIRYPLVELANGIVYLFLFYTYAFSLNFFIFAFISSMLITIFLIDLEFQIIPDLITLPGMVIGLAVSFHPDSIGIVSSAIGLLVGGGVLYLIALLGDKLFKKDSMGGGDIKMAAMLGAFLGWQKVVLIFFGGAAIGLIGSIIVMAFSSKVRSSRVIPFGPYLAVAAFIAMVFGDGIIGYYINNFILRG